MMQQRTKLTIGFTTLVLAGSLAFGGVASAAGNEEGGNGRTPLTTEERCDKVDEVQARAAEIQERIAQRLPVLQERRDEAEANGETERVERLDRRLARLDKISARLTERLDKVETWAAANCIE